MSASTRTGEALFRARDARDFTRLFFRLPEMRLYLALALFAAGTALALARGPWEILLPLGLVLVVYPFYEYVLHRWVLHVLALCRTRPTARIWWRMHYRHHAAPNETGVIFASPPMMITAALVGAALVSVPFASWAAFAAAAAAAFGAGLVYEYFHALAHAQLPLRHPYLARMRRHHLMHHHVADERNFGIVTDAVDRLAGTVVAAGSGRSPTAYNLGYTEEVARDYPYVEDYDRARGEGGPWIETKESPETAP